MILAGGHAGAAAAGPLPRRGRGGGPPAAPQHRADLRGRRARRPALLLAGVRRGRQPGASSSAGTPLPPRAGGRAGRDAGPGRARRPRARHRPPRPEAGQHPARPAAPPPETAASPLPARPRCPRSPTSAWPSSSTATGQTRTGAVLGTPSYMAPEQAGGPDQRDRPAADVYALGGHPLRDAHRPAAVPAATPRWTRCSRCCTEEPVPPRRLQPKVPRDLETICLKCLQKEPRSAATPAPRPWPTTCTASWTASRSRPGPSAPASGCGAGAAQPARGQPRRPPCCCLGDGGRRGHGFRADRRPEAARDRAGQGGRRQGRGTRPSSRRSGPRPTPATKNRYNLALDALNVVVGKVQSRLENTAATAPIRQEICALPWTC